MSLWDWFLLVWSLSGLLGWAWMNHVITRHKGPLSERWLVLPFAICCGLLTLILVKGIVEEYPREYRWGLRFW